jgi:hypothetical protein
MFIHPGRAEFDTVVPHAEVNIINGMHEAAVFIFCMGCE